MEEVLSLLIEKCAKKPIYILENYHKVDNDIIRIEYQVQHTTSVRKFKTNKYATIYGGICVIIDIKLFSNY